MADLNPPLRMNGQTISLGRINYNSESQRSSARFASDDTPEGLPYENKVEITKTNKGMSNDMALNMPRE